MYIAAAINAKQRLIPAVTTPARRDRGKGGQEWSDIVKIGRTHMQDATPLTLGQEWSGYVGMLADDLERLEDALQGRLPAGTRRHGRRDRASIRPPASPRRRPPRSPSLTGLPFVTAPNKFTVQGAHDALVQLSGTLRTLAVSLYKIGNDIRLMSCGPRAGFAELLIPANEPGSSIMPGQGQPDAGRSADHDRRPGHGERCRRGLRRGRRIPRDERLQAADHLQHHPVDHDPGRRLHELPQVPGRGNAAEPARRSASTSNAR